MQHRLTVLRVRDAFAWTSTNARIQQFALNAPNAAASVPLDRVTISASVRPAKPVLVSPQCVHLPPPPLLICHLSVVGGVFIWFATYALLTTWEKHQIIR